MQTDETPEVIDQIHHADLNRRSGQTNDPNQAAALSAFNRTEDVFDSRSHFGLGSVGLFFSLGPRPAATTFAMNTTSVAHRLKRDFALFAGK